MTVTLHTLGGRQFALRAVVPEPVFVADQPRTASAADTPHLGPALLRAWLEPVMGSEPLACIELPSGALMHIRASAVCAATNLAPIRLSPATRPANRRSA